MKHIDDQKLGPPGFLIQSATRRGMLEMRLLSVITYQYQARVFVFLSRVLGGCCKLPILTPTRIQSDLSFTADGKIDFKNYNFVFIFCRPNLLFIRHIIWKNEIYKLIRLNFGIFSIISCLIYSTL
jgi:hypothetical protein